MFFVGLTQLANLIDIKSLIWIYFEHAYNQASEFLAVSFRRRRKVTFRDSLKKLIEV